MQTRNAYDFIKYMSLNEMVNSDLLENAIVKYGMIVNWKIFRIVTNGRRIALKSGKQHCKLQKIPCSHDSNNLLLVAS